MEEEEGHWDIGTWIYSAYIRRYSRLKLILAFQRWIISAYEQVPRDMDVFCVLTQIFLKYPFGLPTLAYLYVSIKI